MTAAILCLHATWSGRLPGPALGPALAATVDNPWAPLTELCADTTELRRLDWTDYDRDRAFAILDRERRTLFLRECAGDGAVEAQVWSHADDTSVILYVPVARAPATDPRLRGHLARVLASLPEGSFGSIAAATNEAPLAAHRLPSPFDRAPWLAALPPAHYGRWFTRDSLLRAPVARVDEASDGTVWLEGYRDPLAASSDEVAAICAYFERARR